MNSKFSLSALAMLAIAGCGKKETNAAAGGQNGESPGAKTHAWAPEGEPFRLTLPVPVTAQPETTSGSGMKTRQWKSETGATSLELAIVTMPSGVLEVDPRAPLEKFASSSLAAAGATPGDRKESTVSGYPVLVVTGDKDGTHVHTLVMAVPPKVFAVVASTTDAGATPRIDAMMASLALVGVPDYEPPKGQLVKDDDLGFEVRFPAGEPAEATRSEKETDMGRSVTWLAQSKVGVVSLIVADPKEAPAPDAAETVLADGLPPADTIQVHARTKVKVGGHDGYEVRFSGKDNGLNARFQVARVGNRIFQLRLIRRSQELVGNPAADAFFASFQTK